MFKKVFLKILPLWDGVEKCGTARQDTDDNITIGYAVASRCIVVECVWNLMAHGDARGGEWRGNWRMEWVLFTLPWNMVYAALLPLMRTPRLPAVDWTDAPTDLNGLVRFGERQNLVSACVPSHFRCTLHMLPSLLGNFFFSHLQFVVAIPEFIYILWRISFFKIIHVLGQAHMISYLCICFVQSIFDGLSGFIVAWIWRTGLKWWTVCFCFTVQVQM